MTRSTVRALALAALTVAAFGCDDDTTDPAVPDEGRVDVGSIRLDMDRLDEGPMTDEGPETDAGPTDDMGPTGDMGPERPACDPQVNLGLLAEPAPIGDGKSFAPRSVFNGTEFGVVWQAPQSGNLNTVWFQRFDTAGRPLGSPAEIGTATVPQHAVAWDGQSYVVAWLAARTDVSVFEGIRVRPVGADGTPGLTPVDIEQTFDVEQIAFDWAPFGGGMLVYNRGRNGADGMYASAVDEGFNVGPQQQISMSPVQSPAVVYGDGAWGAGWLAQDGEEPAELVFVVLNDLGGVVSPAEVRVRGGAIGNVRMAYGQGIYAIGWTRRGALGMPEATLSLFDGGGSAFAGTPLAGPDGVATVSDVSFIQPNRFVVAWQENRPGGTRVGLSRLDANGLQVPGALVLDPSMGSARLGMVADGAGTRFSVWFTEDPTPPPVGYSDQAGVVSAVLAPCD